MDLFLVDSIPLHLFVLLQGVVVLLADNPKYADKLAEMEALLLEQMEVNGDPYRLWNQIK